MLKKLHEFYEFDTIMFLAFKFQLTSMLEENRNTLASLRLTCKKKKDFFVKKKEIPKTFFL